MYVVISICVIFPTNFVVGEVYQKTVDRLQWIRDYGLAIVKRAIKIQRAWRAYKGIVKQKKTRSDKGSRRVRRSR